jgi:hypothetical protein
MESGQQSFPLSLAQERFLTDLGEGPDALHRLHLTFEIRGTLDVSAFRRALEHLMRSPRLADARRSGC